MHLLSLLPTIFFAYVLFPPLVKRIGVFPQKSLSIVWQFIFATFFSLIAFPFIGELRFELQTGEVFLLGIFNVIAVYCQWQAVAISQSKTYAITVLDDLITLLLGIVILNDNKGFSSLLTIGMALTFIGTACLWRGSLSSDTKSVNQKFILYILIMSFIWGLAKFLMRYFQVKEGLPTGNFLIGWYGGFLMGAVGT